MSLDCYKIHSELKCQGLKAGNARFDVNMENGKALGPVQTAYFSCAEYNRYFIRLKFG